MATSDQQPTTQLTFSEYELQVLETITQHAIDAGALSPNLASVVVGVKRKVEGGRAALAIARRRIAFGRAAQEPDGGA